jgi:hypothetical protein
MTKAAHKRKYAMPTFLAGIMDQDRYERWLRRKAVAHAKGDIKRFGRGSSPEHYRTLIHEAVCTSNGRDFYTGEDLHWDKISTYDNAASQNGKTKYKAGFALLPSLDHVWNEDGSLSFVI